MMKTRIQARSVLLSAVIVLASLLSVASFSQSEFMQTLPNLEGEWVVSSPRIGRMVTQPIRVEIPRVGTVEVDSSSIIAARPDIIQTGQFTVFDVVAHLGELGEIDLISHYDEAMGTYVIDSINGDAGRWWYRAHYANGWFERSAQRMDTYLVKDKTEIQLYRERASWLDTLYEEFAAEVARLDANEGMVIIPEITIEGSRRGRLVLEDVRVTAHDTRLDLYQPGIITALDILLSLGEQGLITGLGVTWYDAIFTADPVDHYFVEYLSADGFEEQAHGSCGFVYEVGYSAISGFAGAHIHIPTDARVILSPEYAFWFWLCL